MFPASSIGAAQAFTPVIPSDDNHPAEPPSPPTQNATPSNSSLPTPWANSHHARRTSLEEELYSQENIERSAMEIPEWNTPQDAINHTETHIRSAIELLQQKDIQKPILVLIGEAHISHAATAVEMAAMNVLKERDGNGHAPLLLVENPPSSIEYLHGFLEKVANDKVPTPATVNEIFEGTPLKLPYLLAPINYDRPQQRVHHDRLIVKSAMGLNAGFELHGFDKLSVNAAPPEEREEEMLAGVREAISGGANTALLITGANHVKALHKGLANDVHMITMSEICCVDDMNLRTRKCASYALETPDIISFRGSEDLTDNTDLSGDAYRMGLLPRPW